MTDKPRQVSTDPNNPTTPFEVELLKAADHAGIHLQEAYDLCIECGLNTSRAKSNGVLLACTRLLAFHIIQHCANQGVPKEHLAYELENVQKNLQSIFDEAYEPALAMILANAAKGETKQ